MLEFYGAIIIIMLFIIAGAVIVRNSDKHDIEKMHIANERYDLNTRGQIDTAVAEALQKFIDECFVDYQIMVLIPRNEIYISSEREQEIISDLVAKVSERLSPNFKERLSQYYNLDSLDKVIADKIYITVVNFCLNHNATSIVSDKK